MNNLTVYKRFFLFLAISMVPLYCFEAYAQEGGVSVYRRLQIRNRARLSMEMAQKDISGTIYKHISREEFEREVDNAQSPPVSDQPIQIASPEIDTKKEGKSPVRRVVLLVENDKSTLGSLIPTRGKKIEVASPTILRNKESRGLDVEIIVDLGNFRIK